MIIWLFERDGKCFIRHNVQGVTQAFGLEQKISVREFNEYIKFYSELEQMKEIDEIVYNDRFIDCRNHYTIRFFSETERRIRKTGFNDVKF